MQSLPFVRAVGAGVVVLALVAHVWMFEAPHAHGPSGVSAATTVSAPQAPLPLSGCSTGMSACEVPMPTDPPSTVLVSGLTAAVLFLGVMLQDLRTAPAGPVVPMERAPPQRPPVTSSVVLLV